MNRDVAERKIAALKAIIQTMMPEYYLIQPGGLPKESYLESLDAGDAVALSISNELTQPEIEHAFGWPQRAIDGGEAELRATPVTPFLTAEQTQRLRASLAASQAGYGGAGEEGMPGCE